MVRSPRQEQAIDLNQRAQRAYSRGEFQTAAGLYVDALRLDVAIENTDGVAINLLNLARVNVALGKPDEAQQYLDRLLFDKALHYPSTYMANAAVQYGLLRLGSGDGASASSWADRATEYCSADCKLMGVIFSLRANIAIHSGNAEQAVHWAGRAVSANKGDSPIEHANALRLHGQALMLKQEFEAALLPVGEALSIDKKLGLPDKIGLDLTLLAKMNEKLGRLELAEQYRQRAARIVAASQK
jgi:tetratricopeptide (TPR) repeat protein